MKKLQDIIDKIADPKADLSADPDIALIPEREILLYILQVLARRFA